MSVTYPHTSTKVVPVSCTNCDADLTYTNVYADADHCTWSLHCTACGSLEAGPQNELRRHLWVNCDTIYVGSYWSSDE